MQNAHIQKFKDLMKLCQYCKVFLPKTTEYFGKSRRDKWVSNCKSCQKKIRKLNVVRQKEYGYQYNRKNKEKLALKNKKYRELPQTKTKLLKRRLMPVSIYNTLKNRVKDKLNMEFEQFEPWYADKLKQCEYCDIPEQYVKHLIVRGKPCVRLEFDRIKPKGMYEPNNLVLACARCNMAKSDYLTYEEALLFGQTILKPNGKRS